MATYSEKLRDPRWQRKRLEVLQRENFACEMCGSKTVTLNVHHGYYEKGLDPWEYNTDTLHCLCDNCHTEVHDDLRRVSFEMAKLPVWAISDVLASVYRLSEAYERGVLEKPTDESMGRDHRIELLNLCKAGTTPEESAAAFGEFLHYTILKERERLP